MTTEQAKQETGTTVTQTDETNIVSNGGKNLIGRRRPGYRQVASLAASLGGCLGVFFIDVFKKIMNSDINF